MRISRFLPDNKGSHKPLAKIIVPSIIKELKGLKWQKLQFGDEKMWLKNLSKELTVLFQLVYMLKIAMLASKSTWKLENPDIGIVAKSPDIVIEACNEDQYVDTEDLEGHVVHMHIFPGLYYSQHRSEQFVNCRVEPVVISRLDYKFNIFDKEWTRREREEDSDNDLDIP
jgi:hypothetical protein